MQKRIKFLFFGVLIFSLGCRKQVILPEYLTSYKVNQLSNAKANISNDNTCYLEAYRALLKQADEMLERPCPSVVRKELVPPSGNMHDFMSIAPYWWPDSTKSDGLPYVRRDGFRNPEYLSDKTDSRSLNRLMEMTEVLILAYYFSNIQKYAEKAAVCLRVWFLDKETKMNPHLRYGQAIPGVNSGRFIGIIETRYIGKIGDFAAILQQSPFWTTNDQEQLETWFEEYLDWLMHSDFGIDEANWPNNHGTWFDVQAISLAQILDKHELATELLNELKTRRLDKQITPDGSMPHELERKNSLSYSIMNLEGYYRLAQLAEKENVDLWNYQTLDNPGIKGATKFLVDNALNKKWNFSELGETAVLEKELKKLLYVASIVYETNEYDTYINTITLSNCSDWQILLYNAYQK